MYERTLCFWAVYKMGLSSAKSEAYLDVVHTVNMCWRMMKYENVTPYEIENNSRV